MHIQNRHAAVDDFHPVKSADIGNGSAAAKIHPPKLSCLLAYFIVIHNPADLSDELSIGIIGSALAS